MAMSPRLLRPLATSVHPEAAAWQAAVVANSGSVSGTTLRAVSQFCRDIDKAGIRSKFRRLNLMAGTGLNACLVPLYRGESRTGTQYGNTTDTNSGLFVTANYTETSGLTSNGSNYLRTGYLMNTLPAANTHLGFGLLQTTTTAAGNFPVAMGVWNGINNSHAILLRRPSGTSTVSEFTRLNTATDRVGETVDSTTTIAAGNLISAWPKFFRDGVESGATATTSQDYPSAHEMWIFGTHRGDNGTLVSGSAHRGGWYSIGATMTEAQALSFHNAIAAFYLAIGRA